METIIERAGTGIGSLAEFLATSGVAFLIFAGLSVAFSSTSLQRTTSASADVMAAEGAGSVRSLRVAMDNYDASLSAASAKRSEQPVLRVTT